MVNLARISFLQPKRKCGLTGLAYNSFKSQRIRQGTTVETRHSALPYESRHTSLIAELRCVEQTFCRNTIEYLLNQIKLIRTSIEYNKIKS